MKKILAIVLSCMLIVGVVFALVLTSSAEETLLDFVRYKVSGSDTMYELHDGDPAAAVGEGTIEFVDGVLTLTNTTGLARLELYGAADDIRTVTVNVEGVNTWAGGAGSLFPHHIKATFVGENSAEDKLVISGAGGYLVLANSDADLTFKNVGVSVNATSGNSAVQLGTGSNLILEGNTTFHIQHVANNGLDIRSGTLTVRDTAQLTITSNGTNSINFNATTLHVVVEDSAKIVVTGNVANGTVNVTSLTVKDNAVVDISMPNGTRCINNGATVNGKVKGDVAGKTAIITATTASAPTNVASSDVTASSAKITWDAVPNAVKYNVYNGTTLLKSVDTNEATIDVLASTAYSITVKTVNAADVESAASAAATFTTPAGTPSVTAPAAPTNVAVSDIAETTATVTWTAVAGATSYEVYLGTNKVATVTEATAALTGLTAETNYSVTVKAVNVAGTSAASAAAAFTTKAAPAENLVDFVKFRVGDTWTTLNAGNPQATVGSGTAKFENGVLTLTNTTGINRLEFYSGDDNVMKNLTVKVEGTNTMDDVAAGALFFKAINATIVGDSSAEDKLVVTGANADYVALHSGTLPCSIVLDNVGLSVTGKNAAWQFMGSVTLKGDANLNVKGAGAVVFDLRGADSYLLVQDDAQISVEGGTTAGNVIKVAGADGILVEDNAKLTMRGHSKGSTLSASSLTVEDNAVADLSIDVDTRCVDAATTVTGKVKGDLAGKAAIITSVNANSGNSGNSGTPNNPNTSDVSYTLAITLLSAAVLAAAAVVVIRKKSRKA